LLPSPVTAPDLIVPEQDRIAALLISGNIWFVVVSFFGFGLLLAFTPCVLPTIPILSSIIIGQGPSISTGKAFALSLVFVLAMSIAYTGAGIFAGLFGANLQATFQNPWILSAFSLIFVLFALSMFGLYDLQLPTAWQTKIVRISNKQRGGTYVGVAMIGLLSALIVGPCVAAPLAGALIYIGQTGNATLGGIALFAMSIGMGTPLLLLGGSAGRLLPKAGPWMTTVKAVFGVLLLGVAIYFLERIVPAWVTMLLWAVLLITVAIFVGAFDTLAQGVSGWRRLWKGVGIVMTLYGVALMVGAFTGSGDMLRPLQGLTATSNTVPVQKFEFKHVKGPDGLSAAILQAAAQGKPVMLDFYADWCITCKQLEKYTFADSSVRAALSNTVLLQTDVTANDDNDKALLKQFGLIGPPTILFFGPDGRERPQFRIMGYMGAEAFEQHVRNAVG
ncbi:MAG: protein-disulfide reductase DsbD, partial [Gammaproteobacteria bacterium]|nr:protein-disulfide reductase DsbD [Gammaproteobacteria bacterium]